MHLQIPHAAVPSMSTASSISIDTISMCCMQYYSGYNVSPDLIMHVLTVTPSPTVTHSPVMVEGVNVVAAVAITVVLVLLLLLLLVIGVVASVIAVYKICIPKWRQEILEKSQDHYNYAIACNLYTFKTFHSDLLLNILSSQHT